MAHLEPLIHQRIETSIRSIFHVSPRIMAVPISRYEQLKSKRVHRQQQQRTRPKRKKQDTDTRHKIQTQDTDTRYRHKIQTLDTRYKIQTQDTDTRYRHKIQDTRYKIQKHSYQRNSLRNSLSIHAYLSSFLNFKGCPPLTIGKNTILILSSLVSIKDNHKPSLDIGKHQVENFNPLTSI